LFSGLRESSFELGHEQLNGQPVETLLIWVKAVLEGWATICHVKEKSECDEHQLLIPQLKQRSCVEA
jgi:hypothetical protein